MVNIRLLKALYGDCIILTYGEEKIHRILIDGGHGRACFRQLCNFVEEIQKENSKIDVAVLTHIDSDHIDGILRLYGQKDFDFSVVDRMWFNFGKKLSQALKVEEKKAEIYLHSYDTQISWKQGIELENILENTEIKRDDLIKSLDTFVIGEAKITILSPSVETLKQLVERGVKAQNKVTQISGMYDYGESVAELNRIKFEGAVSLENKSSIAFLFEYKLIKLLFLGDADAETLTNSLRKLGYSFENKLKVDFCKIAHHASKHNTSNELIQMLDCSNYLVSTHQTEQGRPSKECLSRIICNSKEAVKFYCNYDIDFRRIFTKEEILKYNIEFVTLGEEGIDVEEK